MYVKHAMKLKFQFPIWFAKEEVNANCSHSASEHNRPYNSASTNLTTMKRETKADSAHFHSFLFQFLYLYLYLYL